MENINILVGERPARTGDARRDLEHFEAWAERLMRGLEHCFESIDHRLRELEKEGKA